MRAINHALTGAAIGLSVAQPAVALPLALVSHLACDMIPHYGAKKGDITSKRFKLGLVADGLACVILVILLVIYSDKWLVVSVAAFLAASVDFISIRRFLAQNRGSEFSPNRLERFLKKIQWYEKPAGAIVEAVWFVGMTGVIWWLL